MQSNSDTSGLISDASGIHEQRIFNPCSVKLLPLPERTSITVYMILEPYREAHTRDKTQISNIMRRETQNLFYQFGLRRDLISVEGATGKALDDQEDTTKVTLAQRSSLEDTARVTLAGVSSNSNSFFH